MLANDLLAFKKLSSSVNCLTPYIHLGDYLAEDSSNIFRPGSRVSFECFEEHKLIGSRVVECTDVGYWNDTLPTCVEGCSSKTVLFILADEIQILAKIF